MWSSGSGRILKLDTHEHIRVGQLKTSYNKSVTKIRANILLDYVYMVHLRKYMVITGSASGSQVRTGDSNLVHMDIMVGQLKQIIANHSGNMAMI